MDTATMDTATRPYRWHPGQSCAGLAALLDRGGVLAIPSESSYGLGADPSHEDGVASIYRIKGRTASKALPVVAADLAQLAAIGVDIAAPIVRWAHTLWPAALTVVAPLHAEAPALPAAAGATTLAVRIPAHDGLRRLLRTLGRPLTATSANRAGAAPILEPAGLLPLLNGYDAAVVDAGTLPGGAPSTLVALVESGKVESGKVESGKVDSNKTSNIHVLRAGAFALPDDPFTSTTNGHASSLQQE